ncbi:hypothetical protein [Amycolatopsis sp. NPDC051903]|uniref:hypothetical protein n=1 Tax=Amycolatopsis sp. NPDC051903 TaxID=3363936 RepID=UPI0037BB0719
MGDERVRRHSVVSGALAALDDEQVLKLLADAPVVATGIGGTGVRLAVEGVPVFAKRVPLTDLERRHPRSTANLYDLPVFCHYGLGSPEGSAWRELALHVLATGWVLDGECAHFPLLHHWRVLPLAAGRVPDRGFEEDVAYWGGSAAVRRRLTEVAGAASSIVLFCEYFPATLHRWLPGHLDQTERVAEQLFDTTSFLRAQGLLHFDAHFDNFLTDGEDLFLTDFGLAFARRFDLTAEELAFAELNADHDRAYVSMHLVNWLITELRGTRDRASRVAAVRRAAEGEVELPDGVAGLVARHAPTAVVMNDFYDRLVHESRETPFPAGAFTRS